MCGCARYAVDSESDYSMHINLNINIPGISKNSRIPSFWGRSLLF